jgi:putrescine---pyruvate transaminase
VLERLPAQLHPFAPPTSTDFVTIVRGEGASVWDDQGRRYVDALASLWYCNVGHGREEIADAVADQMRRIAGFHTFDRFANEPAERLAAEVADLSPLPDARTFLVSSGSEAVDTALKLARLTHVRSGRPERTVIVSRRPSYHGVTYGGVTATGIGPNQEGFGPLLPDVVHVGHDDLTAAKDLFAARGTEIAAVIAEPVVGAGGVLPPAPGFLEGLRRLCDEHGALLIFDEVICAFGRLGVWWGADRYGVVPDMATFAKAVTSGYQPVGGVVVGTKVREALEQPGFVLRHGHTYSGHPAGCAAGLANLEIIRREGLVERASGVGERLSAGLRDLRTKGLVTEVRGEGAIWAVGLDEATSATTVRDGLMDRGVIARPLGTDTVAFCPPLVIEDRAIDHIVDALGETLRTM